MHIYTIGYGNRTITDFLDLLKRYAINYVIDTRSMPYSRFRPDYRKNQLLAHVEGAGMHYLYLGDALGGMPKDPDCYVNGVLDDSRLAAKEFFQAGLARVENGVGQGLTLCLMCAELRPEDCHRSRLLAPQLEARGIEVLHIDAAGALKRQVELAAHC